MENERMAKLEVKVDEAIKDIDNLKSDRNLLHKMNVLLEVQIEANKKSDRKVDLLEGVIHSVNDNLTSLNNNQLELKNDVRKIATRQDEFEDELKKNAQKGMISVVEVGKQYIGWLIGIPLVIAGWYIAKLLGF